MMSEGLEAKVSEDAKVVEELARKVKDRGFVDPFVSAQVKSAEIYDIGTHPAFRVKEVKIDRDSLQAHPVFEEFDLAAEVDACRDMCGMEYMKKLLATGQAQPEDFYDDGKSGIDFTALPETVHEAKRMADELNATIAKAAATAGLKDGDEPVSAKTLEKMLSEKIKEMWEAQQAAASKPADEGGDK